MRLQAVLRYPAEPARVVAMFADPEFARLAIEANNGTPLQVDVTGDVSGTGAFAVTTRRSFPTDQIPAQARSFVGESLEVRQSVAWGEEEDGIRRGSVVVEIAGTPVRLTGSTHLVGAQGPSTVVEYDGQLKAQIPLFGGTVEEAAGRALREALKTEERVGGEWLTARAN